MESNESCEYNRLLTNENEYLPESKVVQGTKAKSNDRTWRIFLVSFIVISIILNVALLYRQNSLQVPISYGCISKYGLLLRFDRRHPLILRQHNCAAAPLNERYDPMKSISIQIISRRPPWHGTSLAAIPVLWPWQKNSQLIWIYHLVYNIHGMLPRVFICFKVITIFTVS